MHTFIIAAVARDGAIGQNGKLPWPPLTSDMRWFNRITRSLSPELIAREMIRAEHIGCPTACNALIMGRRTWESLGSKSLPFRETWVIGQDCSLPLALAEAATYCCPNAFICGGARVYEEGLARGDVHTTFITEIDASFPEADTHFPGSPWGEWMRTEAGPWIAEHGLRYRLTLWKKADAPKGLS